MAPPKPREPRQPEAVLKRSLPVPLLALLALTVLLLAYAVYQLQTLKTDVAQVREDQATMQNEVGEMNKLLRQRGPAASPTAAAPSNAVIAIANARLKGRADAPLTLIEFSDYQ